MDNKTTVVGVGKFDVDVLDPGYRLFVPEAQSRWLGIDVKDDGMHTAISALKNELMSDDLPEPLYYENMQLIKARLT